MFRYSLRTLLIGVTAIAVFLAVGLPWLRKKETIVLGMLGEEMIPTIVELDPQKQSQQEVGDMERRRTNTRRWMTKQGFRLISNTAPATSDRFVGELPNCGETQVKVNYHNESADLKIEVEAICRFGFGKVHPSSPGKCTTYWTKSAYWWRFRNPEMPPHPLTM